MKDERLIASSILPSFCKERAMKSDATLHPSSFRLHPAVSVRALALTYLAVLLIIPLSVIFVDGLRGGLGGLVHAVTQPVAMHALWLSLWTAGVMAAINAVMGTLTAYVLVRYGPQRALGAWLDQTLGLKIIFAPPGIILALLFITFPFVTRAVQPVLQSLDREQEEAAATIGAGSWTIFRRVVLPAIALPLTTGTLLSFARAIGEFGAIVVVAGNIPLRSQTAAVYVLGEIESENQRAASAMSVVMLAIAFGLVVLVDFLQRNRDDG